MRKQNLQTTNKIQEHLASLNLTPKEAELKTDNDYLLHYSNYLDPQNKFAGILLLASQWYINLINFLCDTDEKKQEFLNNFYNENENTAFCISRFRKHLKQTRQIKTTAEMIQHLIDTANWRKFWDCMQELFLEPCGTEYLEEFKKHISKGLNGIDIMKCYNKDYSRMIKMITLPVEYIKTF